MKKISLLFTLLTAFLTQSNLNAYSLKDLDPFNKNSEIRKRGRNFDKWRRNSKPTFYTIKYKNSCKKPLHIALHYKTVGYQYNGSKLGCVGCTAPGESVWTTEGWWKINPGQTITMAKTKNIHVYFYAQSKNKKDVWQGGRNSVTKTFYKKRYKFQHNMIIRAEFGTVTTNLTCK